ncbi:MAG: hypothetical protein WD556_10425 [Actinomycetota bacterium]
MVPIRSPRPDAARGRIRRSLLASLALVVGLIAAPTAAAGTSLLGLPVGADLSLVVTDDPDPVVAGEAITYSLQVTNAGPSSATGVEILATLDADVTYVSVTGEGWTCEEDTGVVTCTRPDLAVESAPAVTLTVTAPAEAGTVTNDAEVSSASTDPQPDDNTSAEDTGVDASADLSIDKSGPASVGAGEQVQYTLGVVNAGPSAAADISVTDQLPAGTVFVAASGSGWLCAEDTGVVTCTRPALAVESAPDITVTVTAPGEQAALTNQASVDATTPDPVPGNDGDSANTDVTPSADLSIDKVGPASIVAGQQIQYTLTVANAGPSTATEVVVTDDLPGRASFVSGTGTGWLCGHADGEVTCERSSLGVVTAPNITIVITARQTASILSNTAAVSSAVPDPDPDDNEDQVSTTQTRVADLSVTEVSATPDPVRVGVPATFTFDLDNTGPTTAIMVELEIDLPGGSVFASATTTRGTCSHAAGTVTCAIGTLTNGAGASVDVLVTPTGPGVKVATATASHEGDDPDATDDAASDQTTAEGLACTMVGTQNSDTINGTGAANVICGLGGVDTIDGGDGNDFIYAGSGNDEVSGGLGGDSINGQGGADSVAGAAGFDYARYDGAASAVIGNLSTSTVTGGDGADTIASIEGFVGSRFADDLRGNSGDNILEGGLGNDLLDGGGGRDGVSYALATGGVTVSLVGGTSSGADGADTLSNFEDLFGSAFPDSLSGNMEENSLQGLGGDDSLVGGSGFDFARYTSAPSGVTVDLLDGSATGGHGNDSLTSIEGAAGSASGDTLRGNAGVNTLIGGGGNDVLNGGGDRDFASYVTATGAVSVDLDAGSSGGADGIDTLIAIEGVFGSSFGDTLTGGPEPQYLDGGPGDDTVTGAGDGDEVRGGVGDDSVVGGSGEDNLYGGVGADAIAGGPGFDYARYDEAPAAVIVSLRAGTASGGDGADTFDSIEGVTGSAFADTIGGSIEDEALYGRSGNDKLSGEAGSDDLFGETGNDALNGGPGADELRGGKGNDKLTGGPGIDLCVQGPGTGSRRGCEGSRIAFPPEPLPAPATTPPIETSVLGFDPFRPLV